MHVGDQPITVWEVESIIDCSYPSNFSTLYKHYGTREPIPGALTRLPSDMFGEHGKEHEALLSDRAGIVKVYEAVTEFCGWSSIEAGKTMGLFPYGVENDKIPKLFETSSIVPLSNRNLIVPTYPNGAKVNAELFEYLQTKESCSDDCACGPREDVTLLQNRRDLAYACQTQTQEQVVRLIRKAAEMSGKKRVVISGGYGLNCVANYHYLEALKDDGIEIYCEPVSNDAGTAIGAAMMFYKGITNDSKVEPRAETLYLGPQYEYTNEQIEKIVAKYDAEVVDATHADIVELLINKNIVAQFQGRSENGPRALGNRSFLFDPRFADGKDFVNGVKRREYFRPFAGSILEEHVHEWFDLRGMKSSPTMMYAVNCQPGIEEKIPSIIHIDGTCRIQTVNKEQNKHYYDLINEFYKKTGSPIVFNTSFNLGGDPLVETLDDAVATLAKSEVEYLYLPEYGKLVKVSNYEE
jgi:carbamoyltransferase